MRPDHDGSGEDIAAEARILARYLVGRPAPPPLVDRYREADRVLFTEPVIPAEGAVVRFACRHPWSIGFLDGAAGLVAPAGLLRKKLLVMAAILEASSDFADDFLPRSLRPAALVVRVVTSATLAAVRALVGLPLHLAASRSRA